MKTKKYLSLLLALLMVGSTILFFTDGDLMQGRLRDVIVGNNTESLNTALKGDQTSGPQACLSAGVNFYVEDQDGVPMTSQNIHADSVSLGVMQAKGNISGDFYTGDDDLTVRERTEIGPGHFVVTPKGALLRKLQNGKLFPYSLKVEAYGYENIQFDIQDVDFNYDASDCHVYQWEMNNLHLDYGTCEPETNHVKFAVTNEEGFVEGITKENLTFQVYDTQNNKMVVIPMTDSNFILTENENYYDLFLHKASFQTSVNAGLYELNRVKVEVEGYNTETLFISNWHYTFCPHEMELSENLGIITESSATVNEDGDCSYLHHLYFDVEDKGGKKLSGLNLDDFSIKVADMSQNYDDWFVADEAFKMERTGNTYSLVIDMDKPAGALLEGGIDAGLIFPVAKMKVNRTGYLETSEISVGLRQQCETNQKESVELTPNTVVYVKDNKGNHISDAEVTVGSGLITSPCSQVSTKHYCPLSSAYVPLLTASADGYETKEKTISETSAAIIGGTPGSSSLPGFMNQGKNNSPASTGPTSKEYTIVLDSLNPEEEEVVEDNIPEQNEEQEEGVNPATYCTDLTVTSDQLPLEIGAEVPSLINVKIETKASDAEYEESLKANVSGGSLKGSSMPVNGLSDSVTIQWNNPELGDTMAIESEGCGYKILKVEEKEPEVIATPEPPAASSYTCSIDIQPDSYDIYASAPADYGHAFSFSYDVNEETNFVIGTTGMGQFNGAPVVEYSTDGVLSAQGVEFEYSKAQEGDVIFIQSMEDETCADTLTLGWLDDMVQAPTEPVVQEPEPVVSEPTETPEFVLGDSCPHVPFPDLDPNAPTTPYINCLTSIGAVTGFEDGYLRPNDLISKAELIKIIVSFTGSPLAANYQDTGFTDVQGHWAESYIKTAEYLDIVRTRDGERFGPDDKATRADLLVYLARAANKTLWGWSAADIPATDVTAQDPFAYALILAMNTIAEVPGAPTTTIVEGYPDGSFKPYQYILRSEAMTMLTRGLYAWTK